MIKRNIPAFSLLSREFSPKLEGRPIFPTRFNALIWNGFVYAAVQRSWEMDWWGGALEMSVREWAMRQGWGGRPVPPPQAQGMLVATLSVLAGHFGLAGRQRAA